MTASERLRQLSGLGGVSAAAMLMAIGVGATAGQILQSYSGLSTGAAYLHLQASSVPVISQYPLMGLTQFLPLTGTVQKYPSVGQETFPVVGSEIFPLQEFAGTFPIAGEVQPFTLAGFTNPVPLASQVELLPLAKKYQTYPLNGAAQTYGN